MHQLTHGEPLELHMLASPGFWIGGALSAVLWMAAVWWCLS